MSKVTYEVVGQGHISERKEFEDGRVERRSILAGAYIDGVFVENDLAGEPQEVRDLAVANWTPEVIQQFALANIPPASHVPPRIAKNAIWERATEEEAVQMEAMLEQQHVRIRRIYEGATHISTEHELFSLLSGALTQAFGAERAAELLTPTE